jgi:hypothetical protein
MSNLLNALSRRRFPIFCLWLGVSKIVKQNQWFTKMAEVDKYLLMGRGRETRHDGKDKQDRTISEAQGAAATETPQLRKHGREY